MGGRLLKCGGASCDRGGRQSNGYKLEWGYNPEVVEEGGGDNNQETRS